MSHYINSEGLSQGLKGTQRGFRYRACVPWEEWRNPDETERYMELKQEAGLGLILIYEQHWSHGNTWTFSLQKVQLGFLRLMHIVNSGLSYLSKGAQILYAWVTLGPQGCQCAAEKSSLIKKVKFQLFVMTRFAIFLFLCSLDRVCSLNQTPTMQFPIVTCSTNRITKAWHFQLLLTLLAENYRRGNLELDFVDFWSSCLFFRLYANLI